MYSNVLITLKVVTKKKNPLMTKTSFDVYMLFTRFVNLNNVYEVLFNICNTDTNLYDFYI